MQESFSRTFGAFRFRRPVLDRVLADRWPQIHDEVHAAVNQFSGGENIAFGATVVLVSGRK